MHIKPSSLQSIRFRRLVDGIIRQSLGNTGGIVLLLDTVCTSSGVQKKFNNSINDVRGLKVLLSDERGVLAKF